MHLNVLHKRIRVLFEITRQTVLPCLETFVFNIVEELVFNKLAELKVVPLFILWVKHFNLVFYLKLEMLREILKRAPENGLIKLVLIFILESVRSKIVS